MPNHKLQQLTFLCDTNPGFCFLFIGCEKDMVIYEPKRVRLLIWIKVFFSHCGCQSLLFKFFSNRIDFFLIFFLRMAIQHTNQLRQGPGKIFLMLPVLPSSWEHVPWVDPSNKKMTCFIIPI